MQTLSRARVRLLLLLVLPLMVLGAGCSSEGSISGKVIYQNKPLTGGIVLFTSPDGGSSTSNIAEDGSYTIPKMPTGPVKIAVDTHSAQGPQAPQGMGTKSKMGMSGKMPTTKAPKAGPPGGMQPPKGADIPSAMSETPLYNTPPKRPPAEKIPENYADPDASGLTYTVLKGPQVFNIELK